MAAIKLSSTMKRKALNDLFKTLKKEGKLFLRYAVVCNINFVEFQKHKNGLG